MLALVSAVGELIPVVGPILAAIPAIAVAFTVSPRTALSSEGATEEQVEQFLASLRTDEERRTYRQVGKPDRVDSTRVSDHLETAWWYFRAGKVYRFRDGRLEKVDTFAPVEPLP